MSLKILTDRNGKPRSKFWYTRFTRGGEKVDVSLAVEIKGNPPLDDKGCIDLKARGDEAFEKSRKAALEALAKMRSAAKTTGKTKAVRDAETADLLSRYHQARTGKAIESTPLNTLGELWRGLERNYKPTEERARTAERTFRAFADFAKAYCRENGGKCDTIDDITPEIAAAWFAEIRGEYSWGTVLPMWHLMRGAWKRWHIYAKSNPFEKVVVRNREAAAAKVERRPLTDEELTRLFEVTEENPELHGLVVAAACTGMRLGDVCRLKWHDIDLRRGLIDCLTAKAGVRVTVPIFAPLQKVLAELNETHAVGDSPYVFPRAAEKYTHTNAAGLPDRRTGLVRAVKPYFAKAIFCDAEADAAELADKKPMTKKEVLAAIDAARFAPAKKERIREVYTRHINGEKYADIAAAMGIAKGQVSDYLKDLESVTGEIYRTQIERKRAAGRTSTRDLVAKTRACRIIGKQSASLFGWHNLRHTFIVLALEGGVPINDVSRIVGHGDCKTTLDHYGNSTREIVAERMRNRMIDSAIGKGGLVPATTTPTAKPSVDDLIAGLSEYQRKELARKLLGL